MSAFQVAFEVLRKVTNDVAADEILTNLLNEFAHELAEEVRGFALRSGHADKYVLRAYATAADLIDPEVSK